MMNSESILVTGAGGHIGSATCRELARLAMPVAAFMKEDESDENLKGLNIRIIRGDVRDAAAVRGAMRGCSACIHLAALNRQWHRPKRDFYDINVTGTDNVCRAAMDESVDMLVHVSSCEVMGWHRQDGPFNEKTKTAAEDVKGRYEKSKLMAEDIVFDHMDEGLPAVVIRPTAVIGPGDVYGTPPGRLIRDLLGEKLRIYYDATINVIDPRDVALACVAALRSKPGETYIVGGHDISMSRLFECIADKAGVRTPRIKVGYKTAYATACLFYAIAFVTGIDPGITPHGIRMIKRPWTFDSSKAFATLGFSPRPLEETIADTVAWYRRGRWRA
jgi:dihydroflavonol-4-reductase